MNSILQYIGKLRLILISKKTFPFRTGKSANQTGFCLVELLVGITIFGLVVGTSFAALGQGFQIVENSRINKAAAETLQLLMEDIRLHNWSELEALGNSGSFDVSNRVAALKARLASEYPEHFNSNTTLLAERYFESVGYTIVDVKNKQKKITLSVSWIDSRGINHFREYNTFYTELGLHDYFSRSL